VAQAGTAPLCVALVWHMHQPFYKDALTGKYSLPWVRLHALKDYYHMAEIVARHPQMHATFNFVPSLTQQLDEYAAGTAIDDCLAVSRKASWTKKERAFILSFFFSINAKRYIHRYPRYRQLLELAERAEYQADLLGDAFYRDLVAWFNLIWVDRGLLERDELFSRMVAKGRDFTHEDILAILEHQRQVIGRVLPLYRELQDAGQLEITTTPYHHPILPLLTDTNVAKESQPNGHLPKTRFAHPEDAVEQLRRGVMAYERAFGRRPRGLWPAEGSVSQEVLSFLDDVDGLRWFATDEGVLSRSLNVQVRRDGYANVTNPELLYRPYRLVPERAGGAAPSQLYGIFRDVVLSDRIGFVYKTMHHHDAVNDLIGRLHHIRHTTRGAEVPPLVSIVLDGENCWEEYEDNGTPFLNELYHRLSTDPELLPVTPSEYLDEYPPTESIPRLFAGSWINHSFQTWIGERAQNQAWDQLARTRQWLVNWQRDNPLADWQTLERAWEEIYIAEASDWFWWYYSYNNPAGGALFDVEFRRHLSNVFRITGVSSPAWLDIPILVDATDERHRSVTGFISPELMAEDVAGQAWAGAGYLDPEASTGSMQRSRLGIRRLYYGYDSSALYFRIESDEDLSSLSVGLYLSLPHGDRGNRYPRHARVTSGVELSHSSPLHKEIVVNGWTEPVEMYSADGQEVWAHQTILSSRVEPMVGEMRVPFDVLGIELGDLVGISLVASRDQVIFEVLPVSGEAMFALNDFG
jgi:alpha-amylase/alpha-mannosidase (GH57 family)